MKKELLLLLTIPLMHANDPSDIFVLDQIERIIITTADQPGKAPEDVASPRQTRLITRRQLQLPDLAGRMIAPHEKIDEITRMNLYSMYGSRFGIMQAEEEVDKYLNMIAQSNNLKPDEFKRVFTSAGRTEEEGRTEIADTYRAKTVMQMKIGDGIVVPRRKIERYFEEHPELHEPSYRVEYALVPFSPVKNLYQQKAELDRYASSGFGLVGVSWSDPFWVSPSEVAEEKQFIFSLKKGEISEPLQVSNGFELYRVMEIKKPTLEDQYDEIARLLQQPIMEERQKEFEQKELYEKAAIIDVGLH